jgi:hypothetical protein
VVVWEAKIYLSLMLNLLLFFSYLVFLRYSSHFQEMGFNLVRNQGKSLTFGYLF